MLIQRIVAIFTMLVFVSSSLVGTSQSRAQSQRQAAKTPAPAPAITLQDGTPVKLRLSRNLSSADAHTGDQVDFEVLEEIKINDVLVIPKGSTALGTVTEAQEKKRMARGGKLGVTIDYVRLPDGEKAALRAVKDVSGGGHTGAMTGAMVATWIIAWPAAPFFLFMHGKDVTIPKGTEIVAYINGDMHLDPAKFKMTSSGTVASSSASPVPAAANFSNAANESRDKTEIEVSSQPTGADIEIDGNFVGSTPSTIGIPAGQHTIRITKPGFKQWLRHMTVSGGHVTVAAQLSK